MRLRSTPSPDKGLKSIDISSKERRRIESAVDVSHGASRLSAGYEAKQMNAHTIHRSDSRETWSNTIKRQRSVRETELETTIHVASETQARICADAPQQAPREL